MKSIRSKTYTTSTQTQRITSIPSRKHAKHATLRTQRLKHTPDDFYSSVLAILHICFRQSTDRWTAFDTKKRKRNILRHHDAVACGQRGFSTWG